MNDLHVKGGYALISGAALNIFRLVPIWVHEGISFDNFPPRTVDDSIFVSQLFGWNVSHIMGLASVPLLLFGAFALFEELKQRQAASQGLAAMVIIQSSLVLYLVGLIADGLALPKLVDHFQSQIATRNEIALLQIDSLHLMATSFGGFAAALMLVATLFVGAGVARGFQKRVFGSLGMGIGLVSLIGFLSGFLDLDITKSLFTVGPLSVAMFIYLAATGRLLIQIDRKVLS